MVLVRVVDSVQGRVERAAGLSGKVVLAVIVLALAVVAGEDAEREG